MSERASEYAMKLADGAAQLGITLSVTQQDLLLQYIAMIGKWNKVYNLTALRDPDEMFSHHLLDSLAAVPPLQKHLQGRVAAIGAVGKPAQLLDVGSGAGLPGVVFAICCPELTVRCVDTVGKKAAFVQQVAVELKLTNLRGIHARVESLTDKYDVVSSRAFASLVDFTTWSRSALADDGIWFAMKGKSPTEEQAALPADVQVFHVEQLHVPGLDAERCIIWLRKQQAG